MLASVRKPIRIGCGFLIGANNTTHKARWLVEDSKRIA